MTKFFNILLLLWSISFLSTNAQSAKKNTYVKGDVDQIIQKKYDVKHKKGVFSIEYENDFSSDIFNYNHQNIITDAEYLNDKGEVVWHYKSTFDASGNVLSDSIFVQDKLNTLFKNKVIDNLKVESISYDMNGDINTINRKEYEGEDLVKTINLDKEEHVISIIEYENIDGLTKREVEKSPTGEIQKRTTYKRDSLGNIVEEKVLKNDKPKFKYFAYQYDEKGNWVKKFIYSHQRVLQKIETRNIIYASDKQKVSKSDIIGDWFIYGMKKDGFVFNEDQTFYLQGHPDQLGFWSFNKRKKQLILLESKDSKNELVFECALKGGLLCLTKKDSGKELKHEKRPSTIDDQWTFKMIEKSFYGKWKQVENENAHIQFLPDHVVLIFEGNKDPQQGHWHFDFDNTLLYIKKAGQEENEYVYFFEDNQLKLLNHYLENIKSFERVIDQKEEVLN
ncbi:hypothetical protein [Flammeovirga pacifica]|uniref:Uncharacterized protein n=1 Tax=Flammeovirga pacifica TaxID=915059 RepID=A0A1S1YZJ3_FLAPC|nr:hypothetical protein [Flammeovirga pacifica]OHX66418.1 hypothetical protein NH26_08640 [Flammeovirga pacifica]